MDALPLAKAPVKRFNRGFLIFTILFCINLYPLRTAYREISPILKKPRPYKTEVTNFNLQDMYAFLSPGKRELIFQPLIHDAAKKHGVDPALVKAIIKAESSYDPKAVSKKGAKGLMQIMPATAVDLGISDLFNPELNINAGVRYLKRLLNQFNGDLSMALAAYNAGCTRVKKYKGIPPYKNTRHYINKVFQYYRYYQSSGTNTRNTV